MIELASKDVIRRRVHLRIRKQVRGDADRPRLNVFRSLGHIYGQIIDDGSGRTLVAASSRDKQVRATLKTGGNIAAAKQVGQVLAERAKAAGISRIVFDRGGYAYHGRLKALAGALREGGLQF